MNVASIHKGFLRKTLLSILAVILVLSGVSASSFAYAYTIQTGPTIEFIEIDSEADYDYSSANGKYIYFNETILDGDGEITNEGKTLTEENITITVADGLELRDSSNLLTHDGSSSDRTYEITTADSLTNDSEKTYGSDESPAITITVENAGYTSDGDSVDVVYTISTIDVVGFASSAGVSTETYGYVCLMEFRKGASLFAYGLWMEAFNAGVYLDCKVSIYYTGTETLASGYNIIWEAVDLDVGSYGSTTDYDGDYVESFLFVSGFTNPVYIATTQANEGSGLLQTGLYEYNGTWYTRIYGSEVDGSTFNSGFITAINSGEFEFVWTGSRCGTRLSLAALQSNYETGNLTITKEVTGDASTTQKEASYSFEVTLSDTSNNNTYSATLYNADGSTEDKSVEFSSGVATITLTDNQSITITGLPYNTGYTVEEDTSNITGTYEVWANGVKSTKAEGTIPGGATSEVTFENHFETGDLIVSKTISGSGLEGNDYSEGFSFKVTAYLNDTPLTGTYGDMTFTNGVAEFTLTHGQTKTATGLPSGTSYTVEETGVDSTEWTTTVTVDNTTSSSGITSVTDTIKEHGTTTVAFNNSKQATTGDYYSAFATPFHATLLQHSKLR